MASQTFTITLSQTFADMLRRKVSSGEFDSESDVVASALMALEDETEPLEGPLLDRWLKEVAVPIALRMEANPNEGYSPEEVIAMLEKDDREQDHHANVA